MNNTEANAVANANEGANANANANEYKDILHHLENRDLAILFKALQLKGEIAQRQYMRDQKPTKLDGTLYNAYCARTLVEDPIDYVQEEIEKRIVGKEASHAETYYTFFYCYSHDDGWIIRGQHNASVPDGYIAQHAHNCDWSDWHKQGIIVTNGAGGMNIVEEVRMDYDRFGGGFVFSLYQDTLTDETGKQLNMDDHPELKKWLDTTSTF